MSERRAPGSGVRGTAARPRATTLERPPPGAHVEVAPDVHWLAGFADATALVAAIETIAQQSPFRHYTVRGGGRMSVAMTNCGTWGWYSDEHGYRYVDVDPLTGRRWPALPEAFAQLASRAARACGFGEFGPDACLVNRYAPGAQMGAHRDADERDLSQPIVSVSIGLPAVFAWHGARRADAPLDLPLADGDVVVWGASARLGYHALRRLRAQPGDAPGAVRYNLTFRRAR